MRDSRTERLHDALHVICVQRDMTTRAFAPAKAREKFGHRVFEVDADLLSTRMPAHVVLLDDVMTTGTTVREAARTLKRSGVARVDVWAFARAPHRR